MKYFSTPCIRMPFIIFIAYLTVTVFELFGQNVTVTVNLRNPVPMQLSEWRRDPTIATVIVTNTGAGSQRLVLGLEIINNTTAQTARSRNGDARMAVFTLAGGETRVLHGPDIINENTMDAPDALRASILSANALPEGDYSFCVTAIDATDRTTQLGATGRQCRSFNVTWADPPQLIFPVNELSLNRASANNFTFRPAAPVSPGVVVEYRIKIVAVPEGMEPRAAIDAMQATDVIHDGYSPITLYTLVPNQPQLLDILARVAPRYSRFAWQVQALELGSRRPIVTRGGTQGKSEIGLFDFTGRGSAPRVGEDCRGAFAVSNFYPAAGDTLPWWQPHLIMQWTPFCNNCSRMEYTLTLTDDAGHTYTNVRTLNWTGDVLAAQGLATLGLSAGDAQDRASKLITNWRTQAGGTPSWMDISSRDYLSVGSLFSWNVSARLTRNNAGRTETVSATTATTSFALGLKQPQNPTPANGGTVADGRSVNLRFDIPPPNQLMFTPPDLLTRRGADDRMEFGPAYEFVRVKLYRTRSDWEAGTPLITRTTRFPESGNFVTGESATALFGGKSFSVGVPLVNGTYFWQVDYLHPVDTSRVAYRTGPLWSFCVGPCPAAGGNISADDCLWISPQSPTHRGTTPDLRPAFVVRVRPSMDLSALRRGRLQVWEMSASTEDTNVVITRAATFDQQFDAVSDATIRRTSSTDEYQDFALTFVNGGAGSQNFTATRERTYLWRFTATVDGARIRAGTRCARSEIFSYRGVFTVDPTEDCPDRCSATAPANRTPSPRSYSRGDRIRVGSFQMTVTTSSGTGSSLTGEGTVAVPLFRGGILVRYSGIQVNELNEFYGGTIEAQQAADSPLPPALANGLVGGLGLTDAQAQQVDTYSADARRLVSNLVEGSPVGLPIGFDRVVDGERITVGIIGMVFSPTQGKLNAAIAFPLPWLGPGVGIGLGARNICFSPNGIGGDGNIELYLARDFGYRAGDSSWSILLKAPSARDSGSYVSWGCRGFRELRLRAEVEFPRTWMIPAPDNGRRVITSFTTSIRTNGNWIAEMGMDAFSPADARDLVFQCERLVLDQSDISNSAGMNWPRGYRGERTNLWKGFYMSRLFLRLPPSLSTFDSARPPQFEVRDLLIDRSGLSISVLATNIIRYPRGNFGEWGASIDSVGISMASSSFQEGFISGGIKIPIGDSALFYRATLSRALPDAPGAGGLQFNFIIVPRDTLRATLWAARLSLLPTSRIELRAGEGISFYAGAVLNGSITISGDVGGLPNLSFGGMRFTNFGVSTVQPYINIGTWDRASPQHGIAMSEPDPISAHDPDPSPEPSPDPSPPDPSPNPTAPVAGGGSAGGFPLSISDIGLATGERAEGFGVGLRFTISLNLQPGNNAISGSTTLSIWGAIQTGGGQPMRAVFSGIDLEEIAIRADLGAVEIEGRVRFYNRDPTYGNGFRGSIRANLLRQVMIEATAQFGSVQDYRYWFVDARAILASGVPIFSGVGLYGLGGGAWYNMRRDTTRARPVNASSVTNREASTASNSNTAGETNSGVNYIPVRPAGGDNFGFKASVVLGTHPTPDAFNADIYLEVQFLNGGIGSITLGGNGYMMAALAERASARITCDARMTYNFPEQIFDATFGINVNYAPAIVGSGRLSMYFSPRTWYVKIGEPTPMENRVRLSVLNNFLNINCYIMCGLDLPGPPPIPEEVQRITGPMPLLRPAGVDRADGFAFGAQADLNTGRLSFLIFYARLRLMFGFDVALVNLPPTAQCDGMSGRPGINGWYANGQLYCLVEGSIGLFIDLWFISGEFEILGLRAGAALQAGLPNPMWMHGRVGGEYSILGGLIRGSCRFEVKIGERCSPARESGLATVELLADLQPANGATDVPCDVEPQALSNFALEKSFDLSFQNEEGVTRVRTFRIKSRSFGLTQRGAPVRCTSRVNTDTVTIILTPAAILTPLTQYRATVTLYGEELRNRVWRSATRLDGSVIDQTVANTWTTGTLPDTIVPSTVYLSYPRNMQRYFLRNEARACDGTVSLLMSRGDLFALRSDPNYNYTYHSRFIALPANQKQESVATYRESGRMGAMNFPIPTLQANTVYALQLFRRATRRSAPGAIRPGLLAGALGSGNNSRVQNTLRQILNRNGASLIIEQRKLNGIELGRTVASNEKLLYIYFFKTSRFGTLQEKVNSLTEVRSAYINLGNLEQSTGRWDGQEGFDKWDVQTRNVNYNGTDYSIQPFVRVSANLRTQQWHQYYTEPWIYTPLANLAAGSYITYARSTNTHFHRAAMRNDLADVKNPENDLSEGEVRAVTGSTGFDRLLMSGLLDRLAAANGWSMGGGVAGIGVPGGGAAPLPRAKVEVAFNHGLFIPQDQIATRNSAAAALAMYGGEPPEFMSRQFQRYLEAVINKQYERMYYQGQRVVTQTPPSITPARAGGGAGVGGLDGALKAVLAQTYIMTGRYLTNFFFNFCIPPDPGPLDIHAFDKTFTLSR